jgi:1,4-alpha-glucan branching enzyme
MLQPQDIKRICAGRHGDPFSVLGPHLQRHNEMSVRAFLPGALTVHVVDATTGDELGALTQRHTDGFFEHVLSALPQRTYRLRVLWVTGYEEILDDPYRFSYVLGDTDVWLLSEGTHLRPYEIMGATQRVIDDVSGTSFAVWAPNASRVSVVGDFNLWDGRRHPMRLRRECGVWEIFIPGVPLGARYKFEVRSKGGHVSVSYTHLTLPTM